jgi:hypothetical protein
VDCTPYACAGAACKSSCASSIECVATHYCDGTSHCVPRFAPGALCSAADQCLSGVCGGSCCTGPCPSGVCDGTGACAP